MLTNIFNSSTDFYFRTIALLVIFSQYLRRFDVPLPAFSRDRGCHVIRYPLFRSFPVSIAREKTELIPSNIFRSFANHRRQLCAYLGNKFLLCLQQAFCWINNKDLMKPVMTTLAFVVAWINTQCTDIGLVLWLIVLFEPYGCTNAIKLNNGEKLQ